MPSLKDRIKAFGKRKKPPTPTKPDPKGFITVVKKTVRCMFQCVKRQKDENDCLGLPEAKISYAEEEIQESLASRSCLSLTDSESDACPAEAGLESMSDSLEGIPEMLEAESLLSLMENEEEKEDAGKGKDGEKDLGSHDSCPSEADSNPGSASDGSPQPQITGTELAIPETLASDSLLSWMGSENSPSSAAESEPGSTSDRVPDEMPSDLQLDWDAFESSPTKESLHRLCQKFSSYSQKEKGYLAEAIARNHLYLMMEHYMDSEETACDQLMCGVFSECDRDFNNCLNVFMTKLTESQIQDSEELPLDKVKALRGIRTIAADLITTIDLRQWLPYHFVALANLLVRQFQPKEQGTSSKVKKYLVPGEAIDIFQVLLQRLNLVYDMKIEMHHT